MLLTIVSIIMVSILALTFLNAKWGMALLLLTLFLLPDMAIVVGGTIIKKNYILLAVLILLYFKFRILQHYELDASPFRFILVYLGLCLLMIPIQLSMEYSSQMHFWLTDFILCFLLPVAFWNIVNEYDCIVLFRNIIISCIIISTLYGLALTMMDGLNPYSLLFATELRDEEYVQLMTSYYEPGGGRLFGRISSVFYHPMNYAFFLGLSLVYILQIRMKISKYLYGILLLLIGTNLIICGVRTVLAALFVSLTVFIIMQKDFRLMTRSAFLIFFAFFIIMLTPLSDYIGSIISPKEKADEVSGSSIELRMNQLEGAFDEISDNVLAGKGYGWNRDYQVKNGDHPVLLAFESLIFMILCNNGLLGFVFWGLYFLLYLHYVNSMVWEPKYRALFKTLIIFYFSYACITGDYGYMAYFVLFYTLMLYECGIRNEPKPVTEKEALPAESL